MAETRLSRRLGNRARCVIVKQHDVIETLADLVRINSVNPNYEGGTPELEVAGYVEKYFADRGIETWRQSVFADRPNVIARLPGHDSSRRVVLEAHMDTVSVGGMEIEPWAAEIRDGRLYGRGACDTKGGMAAMMHAVSSLAAAGITPPLDVWFAATIDEEYSYRGVAFLCESLEPGVQAAIVAEPTLLKPVVASKGLVRFKIRTNGKSAHSAKPHLGVSAIEHMSRVIAALTADADELAKHSHPLLGPATCNIGLIRGGKQINFVPDQCEIEVDRRMLPGETFEGVLARYQVLLDSLAETVDRLDAQIDPPMLTDLPLETDSNAAVVQVMRGVLDDLGLPSDPVGVPFCSDASKFGAMGIPSIIMGPGSIDQAHAAVEYVQCDQVVRAAEIYRRFLTEFQLSS